MEDPNSVWELPWPILEVPPFQDARVEQWYIQSALLLVRKGYFASGATGGLQNYTMLVREAEGESITVMSTLPVECESHALHVAAAKGSVVIMGAGMGLVLYNILRKPGTSKVVVVERDPSVIQLLHETADITNWTGFEKLTLVNSDAFQFVPEHQVDFLYVDIWDDLGDPHALSQTQKIQSNVKAELVSWWTQEIEFVRWMIGKGFELPPTLEQYTQWAQEIQLPLIEQKNPDYMRLVHQVSRNFPSLTGVEPSGDNPEPIQKEEPAHTMPDGVLDRAQTPDGREIVLCQRGSEFGILVDGKALMSSEACASERHLALLSCERLAGRKNPRVVIGGLGMGFTLRAALDVLPHDAEVTLVELVPAVVEWNRGPLGALTDHPLDDARVRVEVADMCVWIEQSADVVDAILLDVDNGPAALTLESNRALYSNDVLARVMRMLHSGGVLATWSVNRVRDFESRLGNAGFKTEVHGIPGAVGGPYQDHIIYVSQNATGR